MGALWNKRRANADLYSVGLFVYCACLLLAHHVLGSERHTLISGRSRSACSFHMTWERAYLLAQTRKGGGGSEGESIW